MRRIRRDTIRKKYREAIIKYWGSGDKEIDRDLSQALNKDVHIAGKAPGGWVDDGGVLEIYCESGIPNASDIQDFSCYAAEAGCDPSEMVSYNCETWFKIDARVTLWLEATGRPERVFHEPHNGAVIAVHWS